VKAVFFLTMSYLILSIVCHLSTDARPILPAYIIVSYLSISLAELRLYPVGMSVITVLADRNKASTMMGLFFLSLGMGGFLSGKLAYLTAIPSGERSMAALKLHYTVAFDRLLLILILCLLASVLVNRLIRRLLTNTSIG
jgi:POT family proton-dependent oligopeptide transporter